MKKYVTFVSTLSIEIDVDDSQECIDDLKKVQESEVWDKFHLRKKEADWELKDQKLRKIPETSRTKDGV